MKKSKYTEINRKGIQKQEMMMKISMTYIVSVLLLFPQFAGAAEVYGRIWVAIGNTTQVARGTVITVTCPGTAASSATADDNGNYRIANVGNGRCTVQVEYQGMASSRIRVSVGGQNSRANLELRAHGNEWSLSQR